MVGAGQVVPQGHRAVGADEDGSGVADPTRDPGGVGGVDLQVLGRVGVGDLDGLGKVAYQDGSRLRTPQCGRCPLPVPGCAQSALERRIDGVCQLRGVGDEDAAGIGIVLRLGEQVGGHVLGVGPGIGQDGDLGGPRLGIDADRPHDSSLGGGHVDVARTRDDVHAPAQDLSPGVHAVDVVLGVGAVGEHRDGLGAADGVDLGDPQQRARRQDRGVGQTRELGLRRAGQGDLLDAGDLGGHRVHHHAGGVDRQPSGNVEPHPLHGDPALGDGASGDHLRGALSGHLGGVPGPVVGDGQLEGLAHRGVQVVKRLGDGSSGHTQVNGSHAVESLGGVAQCGRSATADVLDQWSHGGLGGGDVKGGPGQGLCQLACGESGTAQIGAGEHDRKPTGRAQGGPGEHVVSRAASGPCS